MTPEGKVKDKVKKLLDQYDIMPAKDAGSPEVEEKAVGWYYMPSTNQFGVKGIPDFTGHYKGWYWSIETKAPGKEPTGFQALQIKAIKASGGAVFVVDGPESLSVFERWLRSKD